MKLKQPHTVTSVIHKYIQVDMIVPDSGYIHKYDNIRNKEEISNKNYSSIEQAIRLVRSELEEEFHKES